MSTPEVEKAREPEPCECGRKSHFDRCGRVECPKNHGQLTVDFPRGTGGRSRLSDEWVPPEER